MILKKYFTYDTIYMEFNIHLYLPISFFLFTDFSNFGNSTFWRFYCHPSNSSSLYYWLWLLIFWFEKVTIMGRTRHKSSTALCIYFFFYIAIKLSAFCERVGIFKISSYVNMVSPHMQRSGLESMDDHW